VIGTLQEKDLNSFAGYCIAYYSFLMEHHDNEEEIVFPAFTEPLGKDYFKELLHVHEIIMPALNRIRTISEATLKDVKQWDNETILKDLKDLRELLVPHFKIEEDTMKNNKLLEEKGFDEKKMAKVLHDIEKNNKKVKSNL